MTKGEVAALFARRGEAFARHDADTLGADYAVDCVVESRLFGTTIGRDANIKLFRTLFAAFPDFTSQPEDLLIFGDRVVQIVTSSGTNTGGFHGLPPTGMPFHVLSIFLFTIANHHIVQERRIYDSSGLLLQLAEQSGLVIDSARIYRETLERARQEQELTIAAQIQRALAPERHDRGTGFELAAASLPCRAIGGDFVDYFDLPNAAFGFALGDVSGKGPPAALLAAEIQGILAAHSYPGNRPADTLSRVNDVLTRRPIEARFATIWYGVLSSVGCLTHCNAGHNPPLRVGKCGSQRLARGGLIIGAFNQATFEEETIQLDPGDMLVVFSDGITEALNTDGEEFGEERLLSCVNANPELPPVALVECLLDTVHRFTTGAVRNDELTLLVLRYVGT